MKIPLRFARLLLLTTFLCLAASTLSASVAEGDRHWAERAEGRDGASAEAGPVNAAIAEYREVLEKDPADLEARWKLLRALRFKGAYVIGDTEGKKRLFDEARKIGEKGISILEDELRRRGIRRPDEASPEEVARIAKSIPDAGQLYLWNAINWGEWAQVYGKLAAVRQGAADRIRRETTIAYEIDPSIEGAGPGRVLGRLHNQTPRVPFLTGWASDDDAVKFLRESHRLNPEDKLTMVFLAEAMVEANRSSRPEAIEILRKVIESPNDPEFAVEHASAQEDAKRLLREWR